MKDVPVPAIEKLCSAIGHHVPNVDVSRARKSVTALGSDRLTARRTEGPKVVAEPHERQSVSAQVIDCVEVRRARDDGVYG